MARVPATVRTIIRGNQQPPAMAHTMDVDRLHTLLRQADTAMYRAKARGGNAMAFFTPEMNEETVERLRARDLRADAVMPSFPLFCFCKFFHSVLFFKGLN